MKTALALFIGLIGGLALVMTIFVLRQDPGVWAVQSIYKDRALVETDEQYQSRQQKLTLQLTLLVDDEAFELRWAHYNPNTGLLNVSIPVEYFMRKAEVHVNFGVDANAPEKEKRRNHLMKLVNVSAVERSLDQSVNLEPGLSTRSMLKNMQWVMHYTPVSVLGAAESNEFEMVVSVHAEKIQLVNDDGVVLMERVFPKDNASTIGCEVPTEGVWKFQGTEDQLVVMRREGNPIEWRTVMFRGGVAQAKLTGQGVSKGLVNLVTEPLNQRVFEESFQWDCARKTFVTDSRVGMLVHD